MPRNRAAQRQTKPSAVQQAPARQKAFALYAEGRIRDALTGAEQILATSKQDLSVLNLAAVCHMRLGNPEQALSCWQQALTLQPDFVEAHVNLGNLLKELKRLDEAETSYRQALRIKPDFAEAHVNLGNLLKELNRAEEAEAAYQQALRIRPAFVEALFNLGNLQKDLGRSEEALASYRQALILNPEYVEALTNLGNLLKGLNRPEEAEAAYRQVLRIKPEFAEARNNLGALLREQNRSADEAAPPTPAVAGPMAELKRRHESVDAKETDLGRWSNPEQLDPAWNKRAEFTSRYIPCGARVLDLGCGAMALENYLPLATTYLPCDVVARDERTRICDFNRGEYPEDLFPRADLLTMLGVTEYIYDLPGLLNRLAQARRPLLVSYCPSDNGLTTPRKNLGWVNHYTREAFSSLLRQAGFHIRACDQIDPVQWLYHAVMEAPPAPLPPKRVLVLSYKNAGNFGDRLGYHVLNTLLPPHAHVVQAHFNPWDVPQTPFDMVILGIGNSLFAPLLTGKLLHLLETTPVSIGIFGTQYREEIPPQALEAVLDRLTAWHGRFEEDLLIYGRGRNNVHHLGDWLISAFPMVQAQDSSLLNIGNEIWNELPLDRTIQKIQQHKRVHSTRLHPLLCALTSAEKVSYAEQTETSGIQSGKFRSMLLDVFGRTFPAKVMWNVNKERVMSYKKQVEEAMQELKRQIHERLV